jgi:hypothetical protein
VAFVDSGVAPAPVVVGESVAVGVPVVVIACDPTDTAVR